MNASPRNSTQVKPASGHATKMQAIGSSASSEFWSQPNCTNWMPYQMNTRANSSTKKLVTIFSSASARG